MCWPNWLQYVPTILPLPLAYAKMGKNIIKLVKNSNWKKVKNSEHRNSWQPMRQACKQGAQILFLLRRVESVCFLLSFLCSQWVLNMFHNFTRCCPTCSQLHLTCPKFFAQCCPLGTYIHGQILGLLCLDVWSKYSNIESLQSFQNFIVMGQWKRLWTWNSAPPN